MGFLVVPVGDHKFPSIDEAGVVAATANNGHLAAFCILWFPGVQDFGCKRSPKRSIEAIYRV